MSQRVIFLVPDKLLFRDFWLPHYESQASDPVAPYLVDCSTHVARGIVPCADDTGPIAAERVVLGSL
jgi:hypothetical protein